MAIFSLRPIYPFVPDVEIDFAFFSSLQYGGRISEALRLTLVT